MRLAYENINSVFLRVFDINNIINSRKLDLVGLVETHLPDIHVVESRFPGYCIYRHDRTLRGGGGIALICRADMNVELVACSSEKLYPVKSQIPSEYCLFSVSSVSIQSILVLIVYRPPGSAHFSSLLDSVSEFLGLAPRVIIMGDFNYNLGDPTSDRHMLIEALAEMDFKVIRFGNTFFHNVGSSELNWYVTAGLDVEQNLSNVAIFLFLVVILGCILIMPCRVLPLFFSECLLSDMFGGLIHLMGFVMNYLPVIKV